MIRDALGRDVLTVVTHRTFQDFLLGLGFTVRDTADGVRVYEHAPSEALLLTRAKPPDDFVLPHQVFAAKITLDDFGILPADEFEGLLRKAG